MSNWQWGLIYKTVCRIHIKTVCLIRGLKWCIHKKNSDLYNHTHPQQCTVSFFNCLICWLMCHHIFCICGCFYACGFWEKLHAVALSVKCNFNLNAYIFFNDQFCKCQNLCSFKVSCKVEHLMQSDTLQPPKCVNINYYVAFYFGGPTWDRQRRMVMPTAEPW